MDEMNIGPFALSSVRIGSYSVPGRPVAWNNPIVDGEGRDGSGEYVTPIKYETCCPYCGNLVSFENDFDEVKCLNCNKGEYVRSINVNTIFQAPPVFVDPKEHISDEDASEVIDMLAEDVEEPVSDDPQPDDLKSEPELKEDDEYMLVEEEEEEEEEDDKIIEDLSNDDYEDDKINKLLSEFIDEDVDDKA